MDFNSSSNSSRNTPRTYKSRKQPPKKKQKTQVYLSLSSKPHHKTCSACGMSYDTLSPDDRATHHKFHARALSGVDISLPLPSSTCVAKVVLKNNVHATIHKLGSRDLPRSTRTALDAALRICNAELSAPDEGIADFFSRSQPAVYVCITPSTSSLSSSSSSSSATITGLALVERISSGLFMSCSSGRILSSSSSSSSSPPPTPVLGISRIYTAHSSRGLGIARALLDAICASAIYGLVLPRDKVAFSQPSDSGCRLAAAWAGEVMTDRELAVDRGVDVDSLVCTGKEKKIRVYIEKS
ncbi:ESCO1/2 acetyl-transferase-domain-containing protein [Myxozyma melibiosi]|uniref:N-acetyltransferase ECO1 n=1 Tax=Myxozyma melibiosi TaxID=54550 RepID=A0ABR1F3W7_9ASCO